MDKKTVIEMNVDSYIKGYELAMGMLVDKGDINTVSFLDKIKPTKEILMNIANKEGY